MKKNKKVKILILSLVSLLVCVGVAAVVTVAMHKARQGELAKVRDNLEKQVVIEEIQLDENYTDYFAQYGITYNGSMKIDKDYTSYKTVTFINEDLSRTMYSFSSNVNYQKDGAFLPIDTRIKNTEETEQLKKGYAYSVAANEIGTYFNKVLDQQKGILVQNGDFLFELLASENKARKAEYVTRKNFIDVERAMISYGDVVSEGTETFFYPSNSGVNCEIKCSEKAQHSMTLDLTLKLPKIKLRQEPGGYWIFYEKTKDGYFDFGTIQVPLIKDKNGKIIRSNNIEIKKGLNSVYTVELLLDETVDLAGATVYLAFETRKDSQPDNCLYSGMPDLQFAYLKNYSVIGRSEDLGIGRLMVRFETAQDYLLKSEMINSADFFIYNLTPNEMTVSAFKVLEDWCSLTGNWNSNYKTGKLLATASANSSVVALNLTDEFKVWCNDEEGTQEHNGIQLRTEEAGNKNLLLLSGDNALFNNYLKVEFNKTAG